MLAVLLIGNCGSGAADGGWRRSSVHFTARPRKAPPHIGCAVGPVGSSRKVFSPHMKIRDAIDGWKAGANGLGSGELSLYTMSD